MNRLSTPISEIDNDTRILRLLTFDDNVNVPAHNLVHEMLRAYHNGPEHLLHLLHQNRQRNQAPHHCDVVCDDDDDRKIHIFDAVFASDPEPPLKRRRLDRRLNRVEESVLHYKLRPRIVQLLDRHLSRIVEELYHRNHLRMKDLCAPKFHSFRAFDFVRIWAMVEINHQQGLCYSLPTDSNCFFSGLNVFENPILTELQRRVTTELQVWLCPDTSNVVWSYL